MSVVVALAMFAPWKCNLSSSAAERLLEVVPREFESVTRTLLAATVAARFNFRVGVRAIGQSR